jgi:hypothetical protein
METVENEVRELAFRAQNGVEVTLLWWKAENRLAVAVVDPAAGDSLVIPVGEARPLDVFHHPYAHAARHGIF